MTSLVYLTRRGGLEQLVLKPASSFDPIPLPGTTGAMHPFFSPDGRSIGFLAFEDRTLKIRRIDTGDPAVSTVGSLVGASSVFGASWADDGFIYFVPDWALGLWRVKATLSARYSPGC